jgi:minimal CRISPR polymerase domain
MQIYVMGDGNKIRERIEFYLLSNDLESLKHLSQSLVHGVEALRDMAIRTMNAEIIMAGGDDLLLRVDRAHYRKKHLEDMSDIFAKTTEASISFGVGVSIESAYVNLRRAKASKSGHIVEGKLE